MATWGDITIYVQADGPIRAPGRLREVRLISDPNSTGPQTRLMGTGRDRKRVSVSGYVEDTAAWESLQSDWWAGTQRTLTLDGGQILTGRILNLSDPRYRPPLPQVWFTAEFIEG